MKKTLKQIIAGVMSVVMVSAIGVSSGIYQASKPMEISAATDTNNDDWLHVCGNEIHDKDCNFVWLTGVNWFGMNCTENIFHGWWASVEIDDMVKGIADHGFNLIRVPISTELLVSWMNGTPMESKGVTAYDDTMGGGVNIDLVPIKTNSMALFDYFMAKCKKYGIKVMIDIHSAMSDNSGHDKPLWYLGDMTSKHWQDSLVWLADKYKSDDTLVAYDLKNEPHGKPDEINKGGGAKWDGSTDLNNWRYAAQTCGDAILKVNPNALIMIEGVETSPTEGHAYGEPPNGYPVVTNYHGAWWGGNFREVKNYPITLKSPATGKSQLVYSPHEYGPSVYAQSWFQKDFSLQTLHDDYMHDTWDYLLPDYPLLIGEWGGHMDGAENQKWMTILRDYMIDNKVHHTFWCYNPNSGDTGGLIGNDWKTWDSAKYNLVEPSLWQDDKGVYIGLDHETPLGANGQSLSDYYGEGTTKPVTTTSTTVTSTTSTTSATVSSSTTTTSTTGEPTLPTTPPQSTTNPTSVTPSADVKYGDINCDGNIGIADVIMLAKAISKKITLTGQSLANANVHSDPSLNGEDLLALIKFISGSIKSLPV